MNRRSPATKSLLKIFMLLWRAPTNIVIGNVVYTYVLRLPISSYAGALRRRFNKQLTKKRRKNSFLSSNTTPMIHSKGTFQRFIPKIHSKDSFQRFISKIHFKRFIPKIHFKDSSQSFIPDTFQRYIPQIHSKDLFLIYILNT